MPLAEPAGVYPPRHPERTVVYRLFEEHFERYVTRGPLRIDVVEKVEGGRLRVRTPPDPLDLIHALTTQIPDPGQHMVRDYG